MRPVLPLAAATVAGQIAYPLVTGEARRVLILVIVALFASTVSVAAGPRAPFLVLVAVGGGLAAEIAGVHTGVPFGEYTYADWLGPTLFDVPLVIGLAWLMMAYPALVVARALTRRWVPLVGGLALASWDLFLDPQLVAENAWTWADPTPSLPGVPGIPLSNYLGWLVVATVVVGALHVVLPTVERADDSVVGALYLWTYASSVLANAAFFGRPAVALWGGVVMGAVAVPYAVLRWRRR